MRLNVVFREDEEYIHLSSFKNTEEIGVGFSESQGVVQSDYNKLQNRPRINEVILEGSLSASDIGLGQVYYDTTENWNNQRDLITEKSVVYVYSDSQFIEYEPGRQIPVAGIKIGDGTSYLIDMPFVTDTLTFTIINHVSNTKVHITDAEREFWDNKISAYIDPNDPEALVFSKTHYELDGEIRSIE